MVHELMSTQFVALKGKESLSWIETKISNGHVGVHCPSNPVFSVGSIEKTIISVAIDTQ